MWTYSRRFLCQCLFCCTFFIRPSMQGFDQKRLLRDLFEVRKYNVLERPAAKDNETVKVSVAFNLQQIINLNEKEQYLDSSMWIEQYWQDNGLIWNPADYGGISRIRLAPSAIWKPDILMYNSANEEFDGKWPVNVVVESTGYINYIPPAMLRSICKVNIKWFPFDEQYCVLKFGSWTYDDSQVNITLNEPSIIMVDYVENGEFDLVDRKAARSDKPFHYAGVDENYPFVSLCLHLQRLSLYYYFNLIIPATLISLMALLVFILPVDSGEKMGLSVTILLSLTVFNMVIAEFIPRTSEAVPLLGVYFSCTMGICSLAVITSVWVLNLYYFPHLNKNPPYWVRYGICYYLARSLKMEIPQEVIESARLYEAKQRVFQRLAKEKSTPNFLTSFSRSLMANVLDLDDDVVMRAIDLEPELLATHKSDSPADQNQSQYQDVDEDSTNDSQALVSASNADLKNSTKLKERKADKSSTSTLAMCTSDSHFHRIVKELKVLSGKVCDDATAAIIRVEWRFASRVVDRACLCVFSFVILICTILVLFNRPPQHSGYDKGANWPC